MGRPAVPRRKPTPEEKAGLPPPREIKIQPRETDTYLPVSPAERGLKRNVRGRRKPTIEGGYVIGNRRPPTDA